MQAGKQMVGKAHVVVAVIIVAIICWLLFARPRLLGQGPPSETQTIGQPAVERNTQK